MTRDRLYANPDSDASSRAASTPRTPCVLYGAKSTEDKHDSIPTQIAECREMAETNDWEIVGIYIDEGFSAYSGNRGPGLEDAQACAARSAFEHGTTAMLIAQAHDRFARGAGDRPGAPQSLGEVWHANRRRDVHLRSVEDDEELRDEASVAAVGRRAYIDSRRKSKTVSKGMARRAAKGLHNGRGSIGFANVHGKFEQIPHEVALVERVIAEYLAGRSQQRIAKGLNASGAKTKFGGKWHQGTVAKVLNNPHIAGLNTAGDAPCPCGHDAIITEETWRKVRALMATLQRTPGGKRDGRPTRGSHIFRRGFLKCGICGESMVPRSDPYENYYCIGKKIREDGCSMPDLPRAMVDDAVRRYFEEVGLDLERTRAAVEETAARKVSEAQAFHDAAQQTVARLEAQVARAERDYLAERLDAERWQRLDSRLNDDLKGARGEAEQFAARMREARALADMGDIEADVLRHLAHLRDVIAGEIRDAETLDALRLALMRLFEGFTVHALAVENIAPSPRYWQPELLVPGFYIEPHPRATAILSAAPKEFEGEIIFPVLRREELPAPQQTTAYAGLHR
jgi:site-specific DNA recombinase